MVMRNELKRKFVRMYLEEKSALETGSNVSKEQVIDLFTELCKFELVRQASSSIKAMVKFHIHLKHL